MQSFLKKDPIVVTAEETGYAAGLEMTQAIEEVHDLQAELDAMVSEIDALLEMTPDDFMIKKSRIAS